MKQSLIVIAILIGVILLSFNCTDLKKDLSPFTSGNGSIHNQDWGISASAGFHGKYLKANDWNVSPCASCHGAAFDGGSSGVSCRDCHESFPHSHDFDESNGHPAYMKANGFPLSSCKLCHGSSYAGGSVVTEGCTECHSNPSGPEACNTCHGNFDAAGNDTISWAPPRALNGSTFETYAGVGAHQAHLTDTTISKVVKCTQCHHVPSMFSASGHLNGTVEIVFDTSLAARYSANHTFNPAPSFDNSTAKCNNTFCHGNWKLRKADAHPSRSFAFSDSVMTGAAYAPTFTGGSSEASCGSCHGLPPSGHINVSRTSCGSGGGCHTGIVNSSGNIVDKVKHMNGKINIGINEFDF
jgi:hypothetical protein